MAFPPGAGRRRSPCVLAEQLGRRIPGAGRRRDPRPRLRHRRDRPLARAAVARPAALGPARPGRGHSGGRRRRPPRLRRRRGHRSRGDDAVRHHPVRPRRSRRREPHHRFSAARPANRRGTGHAADRVRRRRVSDPAQPLAAWRRAGAPGGGVVHRMGRGCVRATNRPLAPRWMSMRVDVWRRPRPGSSRSPSTTPICSPGHHETWGPQPAEHGTSRVCAPLRAFVAR